MFIIISVEVGNRSTMQLFVVVYFPRTLISKNEGFAGTFWHRTIYSPVTVSLLPACKGLPVVLPSYNILLCNSFFCVGEKMGFVQTLKFVG